VASEWWQRRPSEPRFDPRPRGVTPLRVVGTENNRSPPRYSPADVRQSLATTLKVDHGPWRTVHRPPSVVYPASPIDPPTIWTRKCRPLLATPFDGAGNVVYTVRNFVLLRLVARRFVPFLVAPHCTLQRDPTRRGGFTKPSSGLRAAKGRRFLMRELIIVVLMFLRKAQDRPCGPRVPGRCGCLLLPTAASLGLAPANCG
jgi:hypothetical protein